MNYRSLPLLIILPCLFITLNAQVADSTKSTLLGPVTIQDSQDRHHYLPDLVGVYVFAGKKTASLELKNGDANLPQNLSRTIFAKIPGINMWDMDGAGTQMNIGTRGTDAHRSIEMNMRQNGYNTNSDMFGYPENHYAAPMQGVKRIQLLRGSAALQFGSQFGGMMNYVMKEGDTSKVFSLESEQTLGSYNFFNSYNAIGGKKGKVSYYTYYDNRHGDGWRPNSAFNYQAIYANIKYQFSDNGNIAFQFSRMDYRQQIAGGLTDAQFNENARQSDRSRNYFAPKINIPAIILNYALAPSTSLQITSNAVWGERSSVQFINTPDIKDTINTAIGSYNARQVDRDFYSGFTTEARLLHRYEMGKVKGVLAGGFRVFNEHTKRKQKGKGTTGSDFDMSLVGGYGIDLKFSTINYAAFVENIFYLNKKFSFTPGFRYELIKSNLTGVINNATFPVAYDGNRSFPLFGAGLQYQLTNSTQLYANISQAYRPFLYASITPADQVGIIDPNLKDSKGYDVDAGYRGQLSDFLTFDINAFYLFYGNKIGKVTAHADGNSTYLLTTNIGNSVAKGFEMYVNISLLGALDQTRKNTDVKLFSSLAYTHARYSSGSINNGSSDVSLVGNHVEGVPDWIERGGIEVLNKGFSTNFQISYVSNQFNDANNTKVISSGIVGSCPAYTVYDWSFNFSFLKQYHLSGGINNLLDARYFSRRINMYPGPGILPADGRTFYLTVGIKL
ncbi:MAG: TonB-dependent receptor [Chryseolinea sp.]